MSELTQQRLKELVRYDPDTGVFSRVMPGGWERAFPVRRGHRVQIRIDGKAYLAYRLAFLYMVGAFPAECVDHVNGDCGDDRWLNLREATHAQNMQNTKTRKHSSSGLKNVYAHQGAAGVVYSVEMAARGKKHRVGGFETAELAAEFAGLMRETLHGEFARHA